MMSALRGGRVAGGFVLSLLLGSIPWGRAYAQSVLDSTFTPSLNPGVRVGDLRPYLGTTSGLPVAGSTTGPAWQLSESLDITESFTDNATGSFGLGVGGSNKQQTEFATTVAPTLVLTGDTPRVQVNASYSPVASFYAEGTSANTVTQNFNGDALATLVPDALFLDLRGYAAAQSLTRGSGPNNVVYQSPQNLSQNYTLSVSPYFQHTFGGTGTAVVGYSLGYSSNGSLPGVPGQVASATQTQFLTPQVLTLQQLTASANTNLTSQREFASFTTGEDFGQVNVKVAVSDTQDSGNGIYSGATQQFETVDLSYAFNRFITATGEIGHENIRYNGAPPTRIDDMVWSIGGTLTPNPDSSITASYGRQYGEDSALVHAEYAATARLHFFADYTQSLTTTQQQIQNALQTTTVNSSGVLVSTTTGLPVQVFNNFFGVQNSLYRSTNLSLNAVLFYTRDSFSFSVNRQSNKTIATAPGTPDLIAPGYLPGSTSRGTYGSVSWSHDVNPAVSTNVFVQYGTSSSDALQNSSGDTFVASASVTYRLSQTLSTNALYTFSKNPVSFQGQSSTQNYVLVGLHKQF